MMQPSLLKQPDAFKIHGALHVFRRQLRIPAGFRKRRPRFQSQPICGNVLRPKRDCRARILQPLLQRLPREPPHQIKAQIGAARFPYGPERLLRRIRPVQPSERLQHPVMQRLHAERNPVDARRQKPACLFRRMQGIRVSFHADFRSGQHFKRPSRTIQHALQLIRIKQAWRAAAEENALHGHSAETPPPLSQLGIQR